MRHQLFIFLLLLNVLILTPSCGQKGPLYLPDKKSSPSRSALIKSVPNILNDDYING